MSYEKTVWAGEGTLAREQEYNYHWCYERGIITKAWLDVYAATGDRRFYDAARTASSIEELLGEVKTKRYAYARLRRMLLAAYLGVTAEDMPPRMPYLRVLACSGRGREMLREMKQTALAPVLVKSADVRALDVRAQRLFGLSARAEDQYVLAYPDLAAARGGSAWTSGPVIV